MESPLPPFCYILLFLALIYITIIVCCGSRVRCLILFGFLSTKASPLQSLDSKQIFTVRNYKIENGVYPDTSQHAPMPAEINTDSFIF